MMSTTYAFQKEGIMVYRAKTGTSFGSWRMTNGVLDFVINKFTYSSAIQEEHLQSQDSQNGGKRWQSLCSNPGVLMLAISVADFKGMNSGELCQSFYGARKEWKDTILREGCKGRCRAF